MFERLMIDDLVHWACDYKVRLGEGYTHSVSMLTSRVQTAALAWMQLHHIIWATVCRNSSLWAALLDVHSCVR